MKQCLLRWNRVFGVSMCVLLLAGCGQPTESVSSASPTPPSPQELRRMQEQSAAQEAAMRASDARSRGTMR